MGVDTEVLINSKWGSNDIVDFLNNNFDMEVAAKEVNTHTPSYTAITFTKKDTMNNRMMSYHREVPTPLGNAVLLTLSCNEEAKEILSLIAERLGGFYCESDSNGKFDKIDGMLFSHDGVQFFLDQAILKGKMKDAHDIDGLKKYIS